MRKRLADPVASKTDAILPAVDVDAATGTADDLVTRSYVTAARQYLRNNLPARGAIVAGSRVRYRFGDKVTGTVVRAFRGKGGGWYVLWDGGPMLQAATENLEVIT